MQGSRTAVALFELTITRAEDDETRQRARAFAERLGGDPDGMFIGAAERDVQRDLLMRREQLGANRDLATAGRRLHRHLQASTPRSSRVINPRATPATFETIDHTVGAA
jgi:hypothetical protein